MTSIFIINELPATEAIMEKPITVQLPRQDLVSLYLFYDRLQKWAKRHKVQGVSFIKGTTPLRKEVQYALTEADRNKRLITADVKFLHPVHKELAETACITYRSIIVQLYDHPKTRHIADVKEEWGGTYTSLGNLLNFLQR